MSAATYPGHYAVVAAEVHWSRHGHCLAPQCYCVCIAPQVGESPIYATGVFRAGDMMRAAVVDDYGTLVGVP